MQYTALRYAHSAQGLRSSTTCARLRIWLTSRKTACHISRSCSTKPSFGPKGMQIPTVKFYSVSTRKPSNRKDVSSSVIATHNEPTSLGEDQLETADQTPSKEGWRDDPVDIPHPKPTKRSLLESREPPKILDPDRASGLGQILETNKAKSPEIGFWILAGWVLRHRARILGYPIAPDGFVRISDMLRFPPFQHLNGADFAKLIYQDPKERFEIAHLPDLVEGKLQDVWWVRAKVMHSILGVDSTTKRILNMGKLQTVLYRTYPENWEFIQKHGIPEGPAHVIRLHKDGGSNLFAGKIPEQSKYLCVTIDCDKAAELGVTFYNTNDVRLYAVGVRDRGIIPLQACRSALLLDISKESLK